MPLLLICRRCGYITAATVEDAAAKMRQHSDSHIRAGDGLPEWRRIVIRWDDYDAYRTAMQRTEFWRAYLARRHP